MSRYTPKEAADNALWHEVGAREMRLKIAKYFFNGGHHKFGKSILQIPIPDAKVENTKNGVDPHDSKLSELHSQLGIDSTKPARATEWRGRNALSR